MSLKYGEIIKQMSLEEKALMMSGKNTWETVDFEKYGIPSMAMSDGPHGLRRQAGAGDICFMISPYFKLIFRSPVLLVLTDFICCVIDTKMCVI